MNKRYKDSLRTALAAVYTDHTWLPWMFSQVSGDHWTKIENRKAFLDWALAQLLKPGAAVGLSSWYLISNEAFRKLFGGKLIDAQYGGCLATAVRQSFPEHLWLPWKFKSPPKQLWSDAVNRRSFFEWAQRELGLDPALESWYLKSAIEISRIGGAGLLTMYDDSLADALLDAFPEHKWQPWRFQRAPRGFWKAQVAAEEFLSLRELLESKTELQISSLEDWYRLSLAQQKAAGILHVVSQFGGLPRALAGAYPYHSWNRAKFSGLGKKAAQRDLVNAVRKLFPGIGAFAVPALLISCL